MRRQMVHFLQKRKFRLVVRWRLALKQAPGFQVPAPTPFPFGLIFRAFQEIIRLLKAQESRNPGEDAIRDSILDGLEPDEMPAADQYMEMFLTGRDVLDEFIATDPVFGERFTRADRQALRDTLTRVTKELIEREMRGYSERVATPAAPTDGFRRNPPQ